MGIPVHAEVFYRADSVMDSTVQVSGAFPKTVSIEMAYIGSRMKQEPISTTWTRDTRRPTSTPTNEVIVQPMPQTKALSVPLAPEISLA